MSLARSSEALSMMPLWTTATLPSASRCGWAFSSVGAPWVAQRVCAMPVVPAKRLGMRASSSRTRPLALTDLQAARLGAGDDDARGVVAAVLQPLQPFQQQWRHVTLADVSDDSAHMVLLLLVGPGLLACSGLLWLALACSACRAARTLPALRARSGPRGARGPGGAPSGFAPARSAVDDAAQLAQGEIRRRHRPVRQLRRIRSKISVFTRPWPGVRGGGGGRSPRSSRRSTPARPGPPGAASPRLSGVLRAR